MNDSEKTVREELDLFFLEVLPLIDLAYQSTGSSASLSEWERKLRDALAEVERTAKYHEDWEQAKFAVVAWIDEVLTRATWGTARCDEWRRLHLLERAEFKTTVASSAFYERAQQAKPSTWDVFHLATALGFRGCYRTEPLVYSDLPKTLKDLPPRLTDWAKKLEASIRKTGVAELEQRTSGEPLSNEELVDRIDVVLPAVVTFLLLALVGIMTVAIFWSP